MSIRVSLSPRDTSLLRLLSWTPATTALLFRASSTFDGDPFINDRRLRERLQALGDGGLVRSWAAAHTGGGIQKYYKLTQSGFRLISGEGVPWPPHAFFAEVSPSLFAHTFRLAEAIIETLRACAARRITVERFIRENELLFRAGDKQVQPDCFFRLNAQGNVFSLAYEIDNSTASLDSSAPNSIRQKLTAYHLYQNDVLLRWLALGKKWERPRFRVIFLTPSVERAYHILSLAGDITQNKARRLVYAATLEVFVTDTDRLGTPLFLDHLGNWQSLLDVHPTAPSQKAPVRLTRPVASLLHV